MASSEQQDDNEKPHDVERDAGTPASSGDDGATLTDGTPAAAAPVVTKYTPTPKAETANPPEAGRTRWETWLIMLALCSGLFLAALDTTIVTTAIPTIIEEFKSPLGYTWIGSAYLLANAAAAPSWGKLSDIWGRKPMLLSAVAVFWVGSLVCALSISMGMLLAGRAIQGIGGGGIVVLVNISIADLFSMRQRGVYYGVLGMVWAIASAIGPVLGGVFTEKISWRWCFYVNLPICGAGFAILVFVLKLHNPRTTLREGLAAIDWLGSILIIGGTLMFLFGLEFGGIIYAWNSPTVICLLVFSVATISVFFLVEHKLAKYPVIPLRLFHKRTSVISFAVCFCHGFVFISGSYWLTLYFQGVLGVSPLLSGVYLLPFALSLSFVSASTGIWMKKTGQYLPAIIFGMLFLTLGFGLLINLESHANWPKVIIFQIVAGIGVGPNFQAPLISLQSAVDRRDVASATSTFGFIRQLATSMSVVIGGVVFQNEMQKQHPSLLASLGPELASQLSGSSAVGSVSVVAALTGEQGDIAKAAYWNSLKTMYIMYTCVAGLGLLISPLVGQRKLSKEHQEHKTGLKSLQTGAEGDKKDQAKGQEQGTAAKEPNV
ncbi:major facilitator superfamily-domain-containing protein [Pseudomassariella vexata]|uniref:Efflux pump dotC n=1 Tax=Pseudomassariella vexata TaxID=1141098 RepID=A0A1Y2DB14_9PEZI|nr:major facilitator superfamily-domain-containing protein [Pseudomassariella vexata]ORY55845.1 major facilitator superfamily-domain-containing protein [Pseudomassariella vexata]